MTLGKRRFKEMVEAAKVDCYNDSELTTGWFTMIESYLVLPFKTAVLGATVTVDKVDLTVNEHIVARCRRGGAATGADPRPSVAQSTPIRLGVYRSLPPVAEGLIWRQSGGSSHNVQPGEPVVHRRRMTLHPNRD